MRLASRLLAPFLMLLGSVWILQGLDVLGGSAMSGDSFWGWVGAVVLLTGIGLGVASIRGRR